MGAFMPSGRDTETVVPIGINATSAEAVAKSVDLPVDEYVALLKDPRLSEEEINAEVSDVDPRWSDFVALWDGSKLKNVEITPVGMAIGHANARRVLGDSAIRPLDSWL